MFIENLALAGTEIFTDILAVEVNTDCNKLSYSKN